MKLPAEVLAKIGDFCDALKTGRIELDVNQGSITGYRLTESGRVTSDKGNGSSPPPRDPAIRI